MNLKTNIEFAVALRALKNLVRTDRNEIIISERGIFPLEKLIEIVSTYLSNIKPGSTVFSREILQGISLLAEAYDQCGKYRQAVETIEEWAEYYKDALSPTLLKYVRFSSEKPDEKYSFSLTKQKLWICLVYAHLLYRDENYEEALKYLRVCEQVANRIKPKDKQKLPARQLFGTRSRIAFQKAQILYELGEIETAEQLSQEALKLVLERLEYKKREISVNYSKKEESYYKKGIEREEIFARQTYAKILSFCHAKHLRADGRLTDCLQMQQIGRICLHDLNQSILQRLLFDAEIFITKRLLVEHSYKAKKQLLKNIEELLKEFKEKEIQYRRKLLIEKVTILIQLLQFPKSLEEEVEELEEMREKMNTSLKELIEESEGKNWLWRVYLLESRVAEIEKNYESAEFYVRKALKNLEGDSDKQFYNSGVRQAKLQKGRILCLQREYDRAISIFQSILKSCRKNDLSYGLCHLSLAECFFLKGKKKKDYKDIQYGIQHWAAYEKSGSENGNVKAKAEYLRNEFKDFLDSFFIPKNSDDLNLDRNTQRLRQWLLAQATLRQADQDSNLKDAKKEQIAGELGVSRSTIDNIAREKKRK